MIARPPTPAPTPIPILAPSLRPELLSLLLVEEAPLEVAELTVPVAVPVPVAVGVYVIVTAVTWPSEREIVFVMVTGLAVSVAVALMLVVAIVVALVEVGIEYEVVLEQADCATLVIETPKSLQNAWLSSQTTIVKQGVSEQGPNVVDSRVTMSTHEYHPRYRIGFGRNRYLF